MARTSKDFSVTEIWKFVLDEGFVHFGPRMFRQISGVFKEKSECSVFMGTSPPPELANNFGFWLLA